MKSALYQGRVRHRRFAPKGHAFSYSLFLAYLDLGELDTVFKGRWFWSTKRTAPVRFRREDHLGDPAVPLEQSVRDLVERSGGRRPSGPVRLLTHMTHFGYYFAPVSFYYCFDEADERVETIVAEVNNTPWGERHCYVLDGDDGAGRHHRYQPVKQMHVSPFMPMDVDYDFRFRDPDERLTVHMALAREEARLFDATLDLKRVPITGPALAKTMLMHPLMTFKVIAGIHWEALKLWLKGNPFIPHPDRDSGVLREKKT